MLFCIFHYGNEKVGSNKMYIFISIVRTFIPTLHIHHIKWLSEIEIILNFFSKQGNEYLHMYLQNLVQLHSESNSFVMFILS